MLHLRGSEASSDSRGEVQRAGRPGVDNYWIVENFSFYFEDKGVWLWVFLEHHTHGTAYTHILFCGGAQAGEEKVSLLRLDMSLFFVYTYLCH